MMRVLLHDIGGKQIDFGVLTNSTDFPSGSIFLTEGPRSAGDLCLYDPYKFLTPLEQVTLLYRLAVDYQAIKK